MVWEKMDIDGLGENGHQWFGRKWTLMVWEKMHIDGLMGWEKMDIEGVHGRK